ncbi:MAG: HvfC/BufC family peptide modification chaperone [Sulfuriferula sp.]
MTYLSDKLLGTEQSPPWDIQAEMQRQQDLVAAIFSSRAPTEPATEMGLLEQGQLWSAGIAAYRGNGLSHATAALRVQFPTVLAMLGDTAFDAVCARHWRQRPPRQGDLAKVGTEFAETIAELSELAPWPWLADSARLDWALWQVLFEPSALLTETDLHRLANDEPTQLRIQLAAGTRLIQSPWPLVALRHLHRTPEPDTQVLQDALLLPGEYAWVWREGFEAQCMAIPAYEAAWIHALQSCPSLDAALDIAPGEMDFSAWLNNAVRHGWIDHVQAF